MADAELRQQMAREMSSRFRNSKNIGHGGFADVFKCRDKERKSTVAVKCVPFGNTSNGISSLLLREISVLMQLNHANVVRLLDVVEITFGVLLVFECLDTDLDKFMKEKTMDPHVIKSFLFQILEGVSYCHAQKVMHRDLKPQNLLLDRKTGTVKLADFGYARTFEVPRSEYSNEVATLPYKAPELLLANPYTTAVDIWSVGCIFAEMVKREPLFTGTTDSSFMRKIIKMFGVPSETDWPGVTAACRELCEMQTLPGPDYKPPDLAEFVPRLEAAGLDLLSKMLCMVPSQRITAYDALRHPYFRGFQLKPRRL